MGPENGNSSNWRFATLSSCLNSEQKAGVLEITSNPMSLSRDSGIIPGQKKEEIGQFDGGDGGGEMEEISSE